MSKLQVATLSNLQEFLKLHNVQIDGKISEAVKTAIRTVSQSDDGYTLYFYTKDAPVTVDEAAFTIAIPQPTAKADKVANAVKGHLAGLDENGNLVDSGKAITDFDESGAASTAKTEVLTYVGTIPADAKAKDVVNYIKEAVTAGKYNDSALKASVAANTAAIGTLNGTGDGSVKKALADSDISQYAKAEDLKAAVGRIDAIEKKLPTLEAADTKNAEDITAVKGRMDTAEGKITAVEKDLATEKPKIAKNTSDITALQGLVGEGYEAIPSESIKALFTVTTE